MEAPKQSSDGALFHSKNGLRLRAASPAQLLELRDVLHSSLGVSIEQAAEAASYSMAMVIRFALGLSAESGAITALIADGIGGCTAAAAIRHLVNASSHAQCFVIGDSAGFSPELQKQLKILEKMGVSLAPLAEASDLQLLGQSVARSHNVVNGAFNLKNPAADSQILAKVNEILNEARTPVHCVECPCGVNPENGGSLYQPLFASSTLSLGAPLSGLFPGRTYVGRHYICDISLTRSMYESVGGNLASLFSEQPVVQIFPIEPAEA